MATKHETNRKSGRRKAASWLFLGSLVLAFAGCRFKVPTAAEESELIARGTYPNGIPPWISGPGLGAMPGKRLSSGSIPEYFGHDTNIASALSAKTPKAATVTSMSTLERIHTVCPSIELAVNDALTTIEPAEQISKYESLLRRCPQSADLWFSLGIAYQQTGKIGDARRMYERTLSLNPEHQEARKRLAAVY